MEKMSLREVEVQRALGTIEFYWVRFNPCNKHKEEPINLDQLVHQVFPTAACYFDEKFVCDGKSVCFAIETTHKTLKEFASFLHDILTPLHKHMYMTAYRGVSDKGDMVMHQWIGYSA